MYAMFYASQWKLRRIFDTFVSIESMQNKKKYDQGGSSNDNENVAVIMIIIE